MKSSAPRYFGFLLIVLVLLCAGVHSSRAGDQSTHQNRYIYCNVYLDTACFGITSGDALDMNIPADFVLYTITLAPEVKALIYSGNNPQNNDFNSTQSKDCKTSDPSGKCLYVKTPDSFDVLYQASASAPFVHIHLTGANESNIDDIKDFLANFRSCKPVDQSIQCTNERIFKDVNL